MDNVSYTCPRCGKVFDTPIPEAGDALPEVERLTRDLRNAAISLSSAEVRFLVDSYYQMQKDRIRAAHQERTLEANNEPHTVMTWLSTQRETLEKQIARALDAYSGSQTLGRWSRSITGIGPIITAGLMAHIDIERAPTVGHIWRFAGLDPTAVWRKGEKRPHNADLKRLMYLVGESFVKVSGNPNDIYGKVYKERKELETQRNESGQYADQAAASLAAKKFGADTEARKMYEKGMLPLARIHMRSKRYAVKMFLSHYHHVAYELRYNEPPPKPYVISHLQHAHFNGPPNWPLPSK